MISETLVDRLENYRIGEKVRALRRQKKLGLVQLGAHTGLSPGMLSKIERGQLFPTLPTLMRIALVFGVGLDHFFVESEETPLMAIVRKAERLRLPDRPDKPTPSYFFESLDFPVTDRRMEAYLADFPPDSQPSEPHSHDGAELVFVLAGRLAVTVGERRAVLDAGDAMYFDCTVPHSYARDGRGSCSAIVVVSGSGAAQGNIA